MRSFGPFWNIYFRLSRAGFQTLHCSSWISWALGFESRYVPCLRRSTARWARHEYVEASTLLGACYLDLGQLALAEEKLFLAMDEHCQNGNCSPKKVVTCMRHIAIYYEARSEFWLARDTYRVVLKIVEA